MKIKIIEDLNKNNDSSFRYESTPLSYRVSLTLCNNDLILKREYFCVGFLSGEGYGKYYYNCDDTWTNNLPLTYASFITKEIDNDKLKMEAELTLIKTFQHKSIECKTKELKRISNEIIKSNNMIKRYDNIYNYLDNYERKMKINKILMRNNGYTN